VRHQLAVPAILLAILVTDRFSKAWVLQALPGAPRELLPFLRLTYAENTGVAFGMFHGNNHFFIIVSLLLVAGLFYWRRRIFACGAAATAGLALVLAGAVGNIYDRLSYGFVVDFIDLSFFPAIFNIADSSITVGAALLALGTRETGKEGGC
jgi:signal peptidase II